MKKLLAKYGFLFYFGGATYCVIEVLWREQSHWSMFILGAFCFIFLGLLNEILPWKTPLIVQMIIGAIVITILELLIGLLVNKVFKWGVWDYSNMPFNFMGQICLLYSFFWIFVSAIGIFLDDFVRYWFFGEEKPRYSLFGIPKDPEPKDSEAKDTKTS